MIKKCNNIDSNINSINTTTIRNILTPISNNVNINQGKGIVQLLISVFISLYVGYLSIIILTIIGLNKHLDTLAALFHGALEVIQKTDRCLSALP